MSKANHAASIVGFTALTGISVLVLALLVSSIVLVSTSSPTDREPPSRSSHLNHLIFGRR